MVIRTITTSAAMLALIAGIGTAAMAQTAVTGLPAPIAALNLNNLSVETKRDGMREIEGRTADGTEIEIKIDMAGNVVEIEADDGVLPQALIDSYLPDALRNQPVMALFGSVTDIKRHPDHLEVEGRQPTGAKIEAKFDAQNALIGIEVDEGAVPAELVTQLMPAAVRDNEVISQFARIDEIENRNGRITVEGRATDGEKMRADFDADGRVLRFGRDEGRGPRHEGGPERHGDRGPGDRDMRGAAMGDGPRGEHRPGHGPAGHGPGRQGPGGQGPNGAAMVPADFDSVAVNQRLTQAGYGGFGFLRADGPRLILDATNPQGEAVTLELDRQGEVVRETAR